MLIRGIVPISGNPEMIREPVPLCHPRQGAIWLLVAPQPAPAVNVNASNCDSSPADPNVIRTRLLAVRQICFVVVPSRTWPTISTMLEDYIYTMVVYDARGTFVAAPSAPKLGLEEALVAESTVDAVLAPEALLLAVCVRLLGIPHVLACHIGGLPVA